MRSSAVVREIDRQLTRSADDVFCRGKFIFDHVSDVERRIRVRFHPSYEYPFSLFIFLANCRKIADVHKFLRRTRFRALSRELPREVVSAETYKLVVPGLRGNDFTYTKHPRAFSCGESAPRPRRAVRKMLSTVDGMHYKIMQSTDMHD